MSIHLLFNEPLITHSWSELESFYDLASHHSIMFRYLGHSRFHITISRITCTIKLGKCYLAKRLQPAELGIMGNKFVISQKKKFGGFLKLDLLITNPQVVIFFVLFIKFKFDMLVPNVMNESIWNIGTAQWLVYGTIDLVQQLYFVSNNDM